MEDLVEKTMPQYNVPLLMECMKIAARYRQTTFNEVWAELVRNYTPSNDEVHFDGWSSVVRFGTLLQPPAKITNALADGTILACGVYNYNPILVEIALLLGAQLGENCPWVVWDRYPTSKCLFPFKKAYYSKETSASDIVALVDAKIPCPFN